MLAKIIEDNLRTSGNNNIVNYIQPAKKLGSNIISHRISLSQARALTSGLRKPSYYQTMRYYNRDVILEVDKKGNCYCYMEPIQFKKFSIKDNLRYIKAYHIPLSVARFEINDCSYKCQSVTVNYKTDNYQLYIEFDFFQDNIKKDRDAKRIITKLLSGVLSTESAGISSISYKMMLARNSNVNKCIHAALSVDMSDTSTVLAESALATSARA